MPDGYVLDKPFSLSCPECGGVLRQEQRAGISQYRCHIGHVLSAETVLAAQFARLEKKLAGAMACLNERAQLCQRLAKDARNRGDGANAFEAAAREALARAEIIKKLLEDEWIQPLDEVPSDQSASSPD
jgi:two-component system chemotaxis response regulator CheB